MDYNLIKLDRPLIKAKDDDYDKFVKSSEKRNHYMCLSTVYTILIVAGFSIALYLLIVATQNYNVMLELNGATLRLREVDVVLSQNITDINNILIDVTSILIDLERNISALQDDVANLGDQIANTLCIGIFEMNDGIITSDLQIQSGVLDFFTIHRVFPNELLVNGSNFNLLLDAQEGTIQMLDSLVASAGLSLSVLQSEAIRFINSTPNDGKNNVDFVGICNATVTGGTPGSAQVNVEACVIQEQIEAGFQAISVGFDEAMDKINELNANLTIINSHITIIQSIIANVSTNGLFTLNGRLPNATDQSIALTSPDAYLIIFGTTITNNGILTINNVDANSTTGDFTLEAGLGYTVVNDPDAGTVTITNDAVPALCTIQQNAVSVTSPTILGAAPSPAPPQYYMDVNFNAAATITNPPGCYVNASETFSRIGIVIPSIQAVNRVCKPPGKWILSMQGELAITITGSAPGITYMDLVIGLGTAGPVPTTIPLVTWDMNVIDDGFASSTRFSTTYVLTDTQEWCYDVTWYVADVPVLALNSFVSTWTFTEIN